MEITPSIKKELKQSTLYVCLEKCKSAFWFIFWFSAGINLLMLFLPLYTSQVLDRVISSESVSTLTMLTIITLSAFACSAMLETCRYLAMAKIGDWIDKTATPDLIVRSIRLTSVQSSTSSGEAIRDLGVIKNFITGNGIFSLFDTPWSLIYLVVIFMIHTSTGFIAITGIIILVSMAIWNELASKRILQETNEETIRNINAIDVATRNAEVVEATGMSEFIVSDWCKRNDQNRAMQIKAQNRSNVITGITKFLRSTLQISVIGTGALLAITAHKTAGSIIAASILMGRVLAPFDAAVHTWKFLNQARMSYGRLQRLILTSPKREQTMALPEPEGKLEFDRVFFTPYGSNKPTVKGISFIIDPGDVVGVIGASASGKSTIAKLTVGVWKPISGVVRLDGADVYTWNRENFGNYVGYLPQDIELFNTSVKANIARMRPDPNPEEIIKAAKIAGIHELILSLPNGYDTTIGGPGGVTLSGGQKQLLGLARAFYGHTKLLVLDEPNANLDSNGEACLINAIIYKYNIRSYLTTEIRIRLCESLVLSNLNYADCVYGHCLLQRTAKLIQRVQNACARFCFTIPPRCHVTPFLNNANLLKMSSRRRLHFACLLFGVIKTGKPEYLHEKLKWSGDCNRIDTRASLFKLTTHRHKTVAFRGSFRFAATKCWNALLPPLRHLQTLHTFRLQLKKHLLNEQKSLQ